MVLLSRSGSSAADDHPLIRTGLRRALDLELDLTVVGEAGEARRR
jgi:DNA-binding NarL/FixJ family response regulator